MKSIKEWLDTERFLAHIVEVKTKSGDKFTGVLEEVSNKFINISDGHMIGYDNVIINVKDMSSIVIME